MTGAAALLLAAALERGNWNERIHATQSLAEEGAQGLPLLRVAADDADWQVRMTAVHLMGRVGAPAVPDLARTLDGEPCRTVRLTALHWLGSIGTPEADAALRRGLDDESGMVRLVGRYYLEKGGAPKGVDPDAATAEQEDLKACAASPAPGRLVRPASAPPSQSEEEIHEVVVTPDPPVRRATETVAAVPAEGERLRELDTLLTLEEPGRRPPETMPPGAPGLPERPAPETAGADYARTDGRNAPDARVAAPPVAKAAAPPPETLPGGAPGLPVRTTAHPEGPAIPAGPDAKIPADPLPALRRLLVDPDASKRARAADELGKLGGRAASATGALASALKDPDRRVRASAALALGNIGPKADSAVPALVAALKRGPEEVSWSAAVALGRIGTPNARKAFARYSLQAAGDLARTKP